MNFSREAVDNPVISVDTSTPKKRKVVLPTLNQWLTTTTDDPPWLIEGYIPHQGITLMSGHSKRAKKTWLADLTALTVASGKELVGGWKPACEPSTVIYLEEEGTRQTNRERILALAKGCQVSLEALDRIYYGHQLFIRLNDPDWQSWIKDYVLELKPALVIFDALTYMHGGDPNSEKDIEPMVSLLREIRTLGTTVLGLMHLNGHHGEDPKADIDTQFRGSKLVVNAYDSHLALRKYVEDNGPIQFITRQKGREQVEQSIKWSFDHHPDGTLNTAIAKLISKDEDVVKYLPFIIDGKGYSTASLRKAWPNKTDSERRKIADTLVDMGHLTVVDGLYYRTSTSQISDHEQGCVQ